MTTEERYRLAREWAMSDVHPVDTIEALLARCYDNQEVMKLVLDLYRADPGRTAQAIMEFVDTYRRSVRDRAVAGLPLTEGEREGMIREHVITAYDPPVRSKAFTIMLEIHPNAHTTTRIMPWSGDTPPKP